MVKGALIDQDVFGFVLGQSTGIVVESGDANGWCSSVRTFIHFLKAEGSSKSHPISPIS